jgi:hypothetical protein
VSGVAGTGGIKACKENKKKQCRATGREREEASFARLKLFENYERGKKREFEQTRGSKLTTCFRVDRRVQVWSQEERVVAKMEKQHPVLCKRQVMKTQRVLEGRLHALSASKSKQKLL